MKQYTIVDSKSTKLEDLVAQLRAINEYPASIHIYDRVVIITNRAEMWALLHGIEISWYISEDINDAKRKLPAILG